MYAPSGSMSAAMSGTASGSLSGRTSKSSPCAAKANTQRAAAIYSAKIVSFKNNISISGGKRSGRNCSI